MSGPPLPAEVVEFLALLDNIPIEQEISVEEAYEAITSFSVVNLLLAGKGMRRVGDETKTDVLGVLSLYYGLKEDTVPASITSQRQLPNEVVPSVGSNGTSTVSAVLKQLRDDLDKLGQDVKFVEKEGKRQFNLGSNNDVVGNTEFPRVFKRYVDIANDPLLSMDIRAEDESNITLDKEKIGRAVDLLAELKGVILQLVRSLSRYGTIATRESNRDWANFERRALLVLKLIADNHRDDDDIDNKNVYSVLSDLTGKNRETEIAPHAVLARQGRKLLRLAMDTYGRASGQLEKMDKRHLIDLFQGVKGPDGFVTDLMRAEAAVIKRYPLSTWN
jgi:hypothetical protein